MKTLSRTMALKIAAILSFLLGAYSVIMTLPLIEQGSAAVDVDSRVGIDTPPFFILVLGLILGIVAMVAAYGTWKQQRWGIILTIVANAVSGVSALPGLIFPVPLSALWWSALLGVLVPVVIVVLCLWRGPKPAAVQA